jgi:hypothetical protein
LSTGKQRQQQQQQQQQQYPPQAQQQQLSQDFQLRIPTTLEEKHRSAGLSSQPLSAGSQEMRNAIGSSLLMNGNGSEQSTFQSYHHDRTNVPSLGSLPTGSDYSSYSANNTPGPTNWMSSGSSKQVETDRYTNTFKKDDYGMMVQPPTVTGSSALYDPWQERRNVPSSRDSPIGGRNTNDVRSQLASTSQNPPDSRVPRLSNPSFNRTDPQSQFKGNEWGQSMNQPARQSNQSIFSQWEQPGGSEKNRFSNTFDDSSFLSQQTQQYPNTQQQNQRSFLSNQGFSLSIPSGGPSVSSSMFYNNSNESNDSYQQQLQQLQQRQQPQQQQQQQQQPKTNVPAPPGYSQSSNNNYPKYSEW